MFPVRYIPHQKIIRQKLQASICKTAKPPGKVSMIFVVELLLNIFSVLSVNLDGFVILYIETQDSMGE